jgi:hypothetical protein
MSIIQIFIKDLISVLDSARCNDAHKFRGRIYKGLLLLLTQSERRNVYKHYLLFRDFAAQQALGAKHHEEGSRGIPEAVSFYITDVLWSRRLQLANHLKAQPGNAHLLFARLCALNENAAWQGATIARYQAPAFATTHLLLHAVAPSLAQLCHDLGANYSKVSAERRASFGAFYLTLHNGGVEMPEELSLDNVFSCCPLPLRANFSQDAEFIRRFSSTVEHLNERYALLRSCGLMPQQWLGREDKENLSISQLRELKALRKLASQSEAWLDGNVDQAYKQAFEALLKTSSTKKPKVAGFASFKDWQDSEVAQTLLSAHYFSATAFNKPVTQDSPGELNDVETSASNDVEEDDNDNLDAELTDFTPLYTDDLAFDDPELEPAKSFSVLVELFPEVFKPAPVMQYLFAHLLDNDNWRLQITTDTRFAALIANHPRYQPLSAEKLGERLWQDVEKFIIKHVKQFAALQTGQR